MTWHQITDLADHVSTTKAASVGGAGSFLAISTAIADPGSIAPWLQVANLTIGLLVALGSGGLVALKYYDRWRAKRS